MECLLIGIVGVAWLIGYVMGNQSTLSSIRKDGIKVYLDHDSFKWKLRQ